MYQMGMRALRLARNNGCNNVQGLFWANTMSTVAPTATKLGDFESPVDPLDNPSGQKLLNDERRSSGIVEAAFASLKSPDNVPNDKISTPFTDERIHKAQTVNELLSISDGTGISRNHALKVVSTLSNWITTGKASIADFETDSRFIRLCRVLTRNAHNANKTKSIGLRSEDLSTVIGITADDEAAKLIDSITLPQMIKVMSALTQKRRRSTPLLRSLAFNIARMPDQLNLKQSADLLYGVALLNFPDRNLLGKVTSDICLDLKNNTKGSAVVGSILTSLGLLKYKDCETLDALSDWILNNKSLCRVQDVIALFQTMASLNYVPLNSEKLFQNILPCVRQEDVNSSLVWLDFVWSLVLLDRVSNELIASVLNADFVKQIDDQNLSNSSSKLKLLNIDSASKLLLKDYNGAKLDENHPLREIVLHRSKEKEKLVNCLIDTLKNLFVSENHLRTNVNTKMGFIIDAECALDSKGNAMSFQQLDEVSDGQRIALLVCDYHDMCQGRIEPNGIMNFYTKLLQANGYTVVQIPYSEFTPNDKLVTRVKYLQLKIKRK